MELSELTVAGFAQVLASDAPAPGGGSAAALTGAMGAALTGMVANLTLGRKQYADCAEFAEAARDRAEQFRMRFLQLMEEDTRAYRQVSAVFTMPKQTPEEKAERSRAMQEALKAAVLPPMELMELGRMALRLNRQLMEHGYNTNAVSDLGVAFLNLSAAVRGAWLNVLINLGSIKDQTFVEQYRRRGEEILEEALPLAEEGYRRVLELVEG